MHFRFIRPLITASEFNSKVCYIPQYLPMFIVALRKCLTPDSVVLLYCGLSLISISLACNLLQIIATLHMSCPLFKRFHAHGVLDVCSSKLANQYNYFIVVLDAVCLGLLYWVATIISQFQFSQLKLEHAIPTFTSVDETMRFIQNARAKIDGFSVTFSGSFYFVLLSGLFSLVALATRSVSDSANDLRLVLLLVTIVHVSYLVDCIVLNDSGLH